MLRTQLLRRSVTAGAAVLIAATAATAGSGAAHAASFTNHRLPGVQISISCLSAQLCVSVGYNEKGVGDVITVRGGVAKKVATVHGTDQLQSISCAGAAGCVALGRTSNDIGLRIITIGRSGKIAHSVRISLPSGVSLNRIACATIHSCELVGTQFFSTPMAIEVGTWNGKKLSLHRAAGVHGSSSLNLSGVACHGSICVAVGSAELKGNQIGLVVPIHHGKPSKVRTTKGDTFNTVSCSTAKRCYAGGVDSKGGVIVTLNNASVAKTASLTPEIFGIACHGTTCTAVGEELPPADQTTVGFDGTITTFDKGKLGSTVAVSTNAGYVSVAQPSARFFAIGGLQHHLASELTTG
jgi:hypothetical protein